MPAAWMSQELRANSNSGRHAGSVPIFFLIEISCWKPRAFTLVFKGMGKRPIEDDATSAELHSRFGEDADLYAEVRAEAAAAAGRCEASRKWEKTAEQIGVEDKADSDREQ